MSCMTRCIFRWGLISALAVGGATLLIGPERVAAGLAQMRTKAQSVVDRAVSSDNPTALRRQVQKLADEYPQRIGRVKTELAEVDSQMGQFQHDSDVAEHVISLTSGDAGKLEVLIARAQGVQGRPVYVRFEGVRFRLDDARSEHNRIVNVRRTFEDRLATNRQQLEILSQQKTRLTQILSRLEDEESTFDTQMWQLDRQIDSIARNQRLIEMMQQLQATFETYDRWGKLDNLKQLQSRLSELKTIQEAQMAALDKMGLRRDYESRARYELQNGSTAPEATVPSAASNPPATPAPDDGSEQENETGATADSFAYLNPVIVE